ncbi:MAG TPA: arsenosugar biosynthesis radical SAM (seleno)protein ArsS [Ktedonobacteraceae bacterium]|nr:arsenosugar biosynthesis radical SAM (seleno)protein ArsS [Ktedonobacteraceae bacterium]
MAKIIPTLRKQNHPLSQTEQQRQILEALPFRSFAEAAASTGHRPLRANGIEVLQINVGKRCNQTCAHCHVDAGPDRKEVMSADVLEACLNFLAQTNIPTLDITGGAPEMHPQFREIVERASALGRHVIDRCNLTITRLPNYSYLPEFLAAHHVEIIASLPSYAAKQTDTQRGDGVFEDSIKALQHLNQLGYGKEGTGLLLNLITNPVGAFLPGNQASLEKEWKRQLKRRYDIEFNNLYTITNMPISRYLDFLIRSGNLEGYMDKLVNAFNPATVDGLMCRTTLSVSWDGRLYDCDFNQMLDLGLGPRSPKTIFEASLDKLVERVIQVGQHCFGCTAGLGSS